ncbi:MAG: DUF4249 domain-containing protein [Bacteroidales bacterium]|nr:DUF4249 domain-containing protein [Bacteroidales bacterium]
MKTNKLAIAILLGAAFLTSCEKEIEFKGEQTDPKLVINSIVSLDEPVKAYVSKSYFFLDNDENTQAPDDIEVSLFVNGNLIGEMTPSADTVWYNQEMNDYRLVPCFVNDYRPQEGDIVQIKASANGFDDVEGTTSALPKAVDCAMEVKVTEWHGWYQQSYNFDTHEYEEDSIWMVTGILNLTFTITDPNPGQTDCFRLIRSRNSHMSVGANIRSVSFDYDDPIFETGMTENEFFDASDLDTRPEGVFTDMLFDGGSYRIKVEANFYCDVDEDFDPDFFRVPFMVEHLSKEYYHYLNTCNQGDDYMQILAEPIHVYSNVTNGYGVVGGRAIDTMWVDLPLEE